jgi:arabinofuranosyltransferase
MERPVTSSSGSQYRHAVPLLVVALVATSWALIAAPTWTTDDAFISYRYAQNLIEGQGLVFNPGEHVEGYTNFLWVLWSAVGLLLGFAAESWSHAWGLTFYLCSILLLFLNQHLLYRRHGLSRWPLPVAGLGAALITDWGIFATSGLETALFTFLLLSGYMLAVWKHEHAAAVIACGLTFALASLTRPDGIIPALVVGIFLLVVSNNRLTTGLRYGLSFSAIWIPFICWRLWYYGDLFPNTYYAKSADLAWYGQGWHYVTLFFDRYWALLFGPLLLLIGWLLQRQDRTAKPLLNRQALLAAAIALSYTFYVIRVGGDFMFARFMIPTVPFLLIMLETGAMKFASSGARQRLATVFVLLGCLAGLGFTAPPVTGSEWSRGVANEWMYYSPQRTAQLDHVAEVLGRYFKDLPVRVAFFGDEARVVYKAGYTVAIESHAGLTEPAIAHQVLPERGRIGHEKHATAAYLIDQRQAHFTFSSVPGKLLQLNRFIPEVSVSFDGDVYGRILHWDDALLAELQRRGARVQNFPAMLDAYIQHLPQLDDQRVAADFERFRRFYFNHVNDPVRESAFRNRLGD